MVSRNKINYKIYPTNLNLRIKDYTFVLIIKTKSNSSKLDFNTYKFERVYFNKINMRNIKLHTINEKF